MEWGELEELRCDELRERSKLVLNLSLGEGPRIFHSLAAQ
jgi:hypothetical protein